MKNIVILSCGPGLPEIVKEYGHSSDWIPSIINNSKVNFVIKKVYDNDFEIDVKPDAFILTGSKYSVYDNSPWIEKLKNYVKQLIDNNNYILGICFGHQILADCLGGEVKKNKLGWELGSYKIHLSDKGLENKLFYSFCSEEIVYESHQDTVLNLPPEIDILASSEKSNQSFSYNNKIYGVQFHPEFSKEVIRMLMDLRIARGVPVDSNILLNAEKSSLVLNNFLNIAGVN
jgi:GMP synthase (glutamine-hydrolysing)